MVLTKTVEVEVMGKTFPAETTPPHLACPKTVSINISSALLMLGQLTSPSGFSAASPARYWAWLRYFSAISASPDLRITTPFLELDPHQKTILSDDLGVAISTQWLFDRLGGFAEIVDGRRFMIQYASLIHQPKRTLPKNGMGKCPDFVIRDSSNRWHVMECKGTQSDRAYRNRQLDTAYMQKQVIDVRGSARGDRLAIGVSLGNDQKPTRSHIRVIDPPEIEPYVVITEAQTSHAVTATQRLAMSRALALAGFDAASEELALPPEPSDLSELYTASERSRLERSAKDRWTEAEISLQPATARARFEIGDLEFVGQKAIVPIPGVDFVKNTERTSIKISQGIRSTYADELRRLGSNDRAVVDSLGETYLKESKIEIVSSENATTLRIGQLYAARLEFI